MPKKPTFTEMFPSEIYPDLLGHPPSAALSGHLSDIALAGDIPLSRLFSALPASVAQDIQREAKRAWEEEHNAAPRG